MHTRCPINWYHFRSGDQTTFEPGACFKPGNWNNIVQTCSLFQVAASEVSQQEPLLVSAPPTRPSRTDHTISSFEDRARACALSRTQSHPHKAARKEKWRGRESTQEREGKKCPRLAAEKCARVLLVHVSHSFTLLEAGTPLHTPKTTNGRKKKNWLGMLEAWESSRKTYCFSLARTATVCNRVSLQYATKHTRES